MTTAASTTKRFHVLIQSELRGLQNERCLFQVYDTTTLKEFKEQIISRNDEVSVVRTYIEQLILSYRDEEIPHYPIDSGITLYEALHLNDDILRQTQNVVKLIVSVHENVNGPSVDFWRDVRSEGRLEFSPRQDNEEIPQSQSNGQAEPVAESTGETEIPTPSLTAPVPTPPNIDPIDPTRIAVQGGSVWEMSGDTFETIIDSVTGNKKLVEQEDLSRLEYVFTLEIEGETKKVTLNSSQCIIVDNGEHSPYLLLNPLASAKLVSEFKLSSGERLMQKVQIMLYTPQPTPTQPVPVPEQDQRHHHHQGVEDQVNDNLQQRIVDIGTRFGVAAFKIGVVLFLLGVRPGQHLIQNWFKYLVLFIVLFNSYVMFFTGPNRIIRFPGGGFDSVDAMADAVVRRMVTRTTDRDLILLTDPNWLKIIKWNVETISKDVILSVMSMVPWLQSKIYEELDNIDDPAEVYEELIRQLDGDIEEEVVNVGEENNDTE